MKKFISVVMLAVILTLGVGAFAMAQSPTVEPIPSDVAPPTAGVPEKGTELLTKITIMGNWTFAVLLTISIIFIVIAAFQFVTGQGNAEKMTEARQKLIYAALGIGIALLATGIDDVLRSILGVS